MAAASEFETKPVAPGELQEARQFAASYAGEHVAGTEFVIGALFVAWGVSTYDILVGLLLGNLLAVLTWGLVTAPIATDTLCPCVAYVMPFSQVRDGTASSSTGGVGNSISKITPEAPEELIVEDPAAVLRGASGSGSPANATLFQFCATARSTPREPRSEPMTMRVPSARKTVMVDSTMPPQLPL